MDRILARWRLPALLALLALLAGCQRADDPSTLPTAAETIVEVGKRLGRGLSPEDLTRLGSDEDRLLRALTGAERDSLSRAYVRFRLDAPATVLLGLPPGLEPFWVREAGFLPTGRSLDHPDGRFRLWSRHDKAGTVGLGVNALDRRARGHYLVLVQGDDRPADLAARPPLGWRATPLADGATPYTDDGRPFGEIPDDLAGACLLQPRKDWRDSTALIRSKVWKTRIPSGPLADQVVLSFGLDPARSLSWTWRTDPSVAISRVKLEHADGRPVGVFEGETIPIDSAGLLNDPTILRHRVAAASLDPNTDYRYSVNDGSPAGWSAWYAARTGPAGPRDYAFLEMGDPQCGLEEWGKLLASARRSRPDAGFLLIAGDLVDRGNERSNWDHFFLRAAGVFESLPLLPCVGNHEYLDRGPAIFSANFRLPENAPADVPNRLSYAFEYSDSFVAVLDSNPAVYSPTMARRQADWLDGRLSATRARWKVVVFHHPAYASHPSRSQPQIAEAWVPVFDKHGVDLVLQGHDHAYLRTYPMHAGRRVNSSEAGTTYVVSVSGQKFVPLADRDYTAKGFADVATYQTIDVSPTGGRLLYRAFDVEGRERDRLELTKPSEVAASGRGRVSPAR